MCRQRVTATCGFILHMAAATQRYFSTPRKGRNHRMSKRHSNVVLKLVVPALMLMLPLLIVAGGSAMPVQAGAKIQTVPAGSAQDSNKLLVVRAYFRSVEERNRIAADFGAEEVPTTSGYLTLFLDHDRYKALQA